MLAKRQQGLYDSFYESAHNNQYLDDLKNVCLSMTAAFVSHVTGWRMVCRSR
jgi:hypothetical protein